MSLMTRSGFDDVLSSFESVSFVDQWDAHVAKVADKVFAVLGQKESWRIVIKVTEESFEILTALEGISQAPYFAKRKWININESSPLSEDDLLHYVRRSYELVAAGLSQKRRNELGIVIS